MTADDLKILENAFAEAIELAPVTQDNFIERFAADHPHLEDELRALLAADADADQSLTAAMGTSIEVATDQLEDPWVGKTLGSWQTIRRLGTGGMGAVFLVERVDGQFRQTAALKLMGSRLLSLEALARFRAERQILANLKHPNIATLIDGGAAEQDLPYLVMEYVDGSHIDRYCDDQRLTIAERLRLFQKVCAAVDYAHRNLVVHRDLKPSNILVDGGGEPKLLDFGIAKLLDPTDQDASVFATDANARAMTPEYASPEQVRGEQVSVATDVYALGVLLFRLLTGRSPYGAATTTQRELESAILDRDPTRPSNVVTALSTTESDEESGNTQELSSQRQATPQALRKLLIGDLDNIVLMCLQKDADRRYASARELAADVNRYLNQLPVHARGDDWLYLASKYVNRNARAIAATATALLTLVSLMAYYTLQLADERDRAQVASGQAQQIADFLGSVFKSADPAIAKGSELTARELLQRGAADINEIEEPLIKAELQRVIGASLVELGEPEAGRKMLEQSVVTFRTDPEAGPISLARSLDGLGQAYTRLSNHDLSVANRREAVKLAEETLGVDHPELTGYWSQLGHSLSNALEYEEALAVWEQTLELKKQQGTYGDGQTSDVLGSIATLHDNRGNYVEAVRLGHEALVMSERELGPLDPNTVIMVGNLGLVYARQGDWEQAFLHLEDCVTRGRQLWPAEHPRLMFFLNNTALVAMRLEDFDYAETVIAEVEKIERGRNGGESVSLVGHLYSSSGLYTVRGDYEGAYERYAEAHALGTRLMGEDSELVLTSGIGMGTSLLSLGRYSEAVTVLQGVLKHEAQLRRVNILHAQLNLGRAMSGVGNAEAGSLLTKTIAAKAADVGPANIEMREYLWAGAVHFRRAQVYEQALTYAERLYQIEQTARANPRLADDGSAAAEYGLTLAAQGRGAEALPLLREAQRDLAGANSADELTIREVADALAELAMQPTETARP